MSMRQRQVCWERVWGEFYPPADGAMTATRSIIIVTRYTRTSDQTTQSLFTLRDKVFNRESCINADVCSYGILMLIYSVPQTMSKG